MGKNTGIVLAAALVGGVVGSLTTALVIGPRRSEGPPGAAQTGEQSATPQQVWQGSQGARHPVDAAFGELLEGRLADALVMFDDAIASGAAGERSDEALFWKARALRDLQRPDEAVAVLRELVEKHPESRFADDALFQRAEILERDLFKFEEALVCYEDLEKSHPGSTLNAAAKLREGEIQYSVQNDMPQAMKSWSKAQEYGSYSYGQQDAQTEPDQRPPPEQPPAGVEQQKLGRNYEARRALERIRFIRDNSSGGAEALTLYAKAEHALELDRLPEAIELLGQLLDRFPEHSLADDAQFQIGEAYRRSGLIVEARAAHRKLVDAHPESPHREQALLRLSQLADLHAKQRRMMRVQEAQSR